MPLAYAGIAILVVGALVLVLGNSSDSIAGFAHSDFARLVTGIALLIVIGGGMFASRRLRIGTALRHAVIWLTVALALVVAYSYRGEFLGVANRTVGELVPGMPVASTDPDGLTSIALRRGGNGHFSVRGRVGDTTATLIVDTGASRLTLSDTTAREAGIDMDGLRYGVPAQTANGTVMVAATRLATLEIGPVVFTDVPAFVAPPGALGTDLLGVNVLDRLESYEVRGNEMVLRVRR